MLINGSYFPKSMLIYGLGLVGWLTPRTPSNSACIKVIFTNQGELSREQGGKAERGEGGGSPHSLLIIRHVTFTTISITKKVNY